VPVSNLILTRFGFKKSEEQGFFCLRRFEIGEVIVLGPGLSVDVKGSLQKMKDSESLIQDAGGDHSSVVTRGIIANYGLTNLYRKWIGM